MVTNLWDKVSFFSGNCRFVTGPAAVMEPVVVVVDINSAGASCFQKLLQRNFRPSSSHLLLRSHPVCQGTLWDAL